MRRSIIVLAIAVGLLAALTVAPAAAGPPEWPEERLFLLCGDDPDLEPCVDTFDANVPFFVIHGVYFEHGKDYNQKGVAPAAGHYDFNLYVNGEEIEEDWTYHWWTVTWKLFIFPEGLAGEDPFLFHGEWIGTCTHDDVGVVDGCDKPSDTLVILDTYVPITFE